MLCDARPVRVARRRQLFERTVAASRLCSIDRIPSSPAPAPSGSCGTPDPFASLGGGTCSNGGWLPPGMIAPSILPTPPTPPPPPPAAPSTPVGCTTPDPFVSLGGGTCSRGGWLPPGMAAPSGGGGSSNPAWLHHAGSLRVARRRNLHQRRLASTRHGGQRTASRPIRSSPSEAERARTVAGCRQASCRTPQASLPRRRAIAPRPIRS